MKGLLIYFEVKDGMQAEFEKTMGNLASLVREKDPTYSLYSISKVKDSDTRYISVQRFDSYESQMAHRDYDYVLEAMGPIMPCIASEPTMDFLEILD